MPSHFRERTPELETRSRTVVSERIRWQSFQRDTGEYQLQLWCVAVKKALEESISLRTERVKLVKGASPAVGGCRERNTVAVCRPDELPSDHQLISNISPKPQRHNYQSPS